MHLASKRLAAPLLFLAWCAFALWQYAGYRRERDLLRTSLQEQTHSILHAVVGGVESHRRRGPYYREQLQGMIDELAGSQDILAAAILAADGATVASAGAYDNLRLNADVAPGAYWYDAGFRLVEHFELPPAEPGGGGLGRGPGRGQGQRGNRNRAANDAPFTSGGAYIAGILVDREKTDSLIRHAINSHLLVGFAGALVTAIAYVAWRASVKVINAQAESQLLQRESKHLRELSQAAAGLAHETRNPLGIIRGWTQRLAQSEPDKDRQRQAQLVIEECDRLTARINQFLAFAKPQTPHQEAVPLRQLFDELSMLLEPDLSEQHLRLETHLTPPETTVTADRELLRQALFNLLQNAIQFSPMGEAITITATRNNGLGCRIEVCDHGPGVAADSVDSLFTPYYTTRSDGTGLGLAIVRQIASAHGWQVDYRPRTGGGSQFMLENIDG